MKAWIEKLRERRDLERAEAAEAMATIMAGEATDAQIAAFLMALAMKGERPSELVGLAETMRARAVPLAGQYPDAFDTCGTGGDRTGTFNISTVTAIVLAGCGLRMAKHGNRAVSSACGSADVLTELGVNIAPPAPVVERCLRAGMAFFFAPSFHPAMRHAATARREVGIRTAFNLLGPLTNPTGPRRQLIGVSRPEHTELLARALQLLGSERAWVVHGADGTDEISTAGHTKVSELKGGAVNTFYIHPRDFGVSRVGASDLRGGDAATNAGIARRVLARARGPHRDVVLLNAGAALLVAGRAPTVADGMALAAAAIDSGAAAEALERLKTQSHASEAVA